MKALNTIPVREFHIFIVAVSLLAMTAGYTNAIGMVGVKATLTHMTGVITRLGWSLALSEYQQLEGDLASLFSYSFGGFFAAAVVGPEGRWQLSWKYGATFILGGIFLLIPTFATSWDLPAIMTKMMIASAMGLQNGMTSVWSAGAGRSTHLTGFVVDIVIVFAMFAIACFRSDLWRAKFVFPILFCFLFGAFLGGLAYSHIGKYALIVSACVHFISAGIVFAREPIFKYLTTVGTGGRVEFDNETPTAAGGPAPPHDQVILQFGPTGKESHVEQQELSLYNTI